MIIILVIAAMTASLSGAALVIKQHRDARAERIVRDHYEAIVDRQRDLIHRSFGSMDPVSGEFRSRQGERSADLAEDPHDEAFEAAWIAPSQEVIDKIDAVLSERDRAAMDARREADRKRVDDSIAEASRRSLAEIRKADGWSYDPRTDSWTQVAVPQPTVGFSPGGWIPPAHPRNRLNTGPL